VAEQRFEHVGRQRQQMVDLIRGAHSLKGQRLEVGALDGQWLAASAVLFGHAYAVAAGRGVVQEHAGGNSVELRARLEVLNGHACADAEALRTRTVGNVDHRLSATVCDVGGRGRRGCLGCLGRRHAGSSAAQQR
jgi:hypothetical protein